MANRENEALTIFSPMFKSRLITALVASSLIVAMLSSCQTSSTEVDPQANIIKFSGTTSVGQTLDSVSWNFNSDSGAGKIQLQAGTANTYDVQLTLPRDPGTTPVSVVFWRLSIKVGISPVTSGALGKSTWRDTLGNILLARLDSLRRTKDSTTYQESVQSLVQIYAHALVDGDTLFNGFPKRRVTTLDTAAIYKAAIVYAAGKRISYAVLSKTWKLGLDSATTCKLVAKLMAPAGPISSADSLALFPAYPVRVSAPVAVGPMNVGGSAVPVSGSFVGDSGLSAYKVRILQGSLDVSDQFIIATQPTQLDGSQTAWNLATDARLTLQVKSAKVGSYTLEVSVSDKRNRTDTSRAQFAVAPPPDRTGPTITWLAPTSSLLLEYKDSIIVAKITASDASGIDSVWFDGKPITKTDSTWSVSVVIPVRDLGYDLKVKVRDLVGNTTDSSLRIVRQKEPAPGAPIVRLVSPASRTGNFLPFDSMNFRVSWSISDPIGVDSTSVMVQGATSWTRQDSIWTATVPVPPTGSDYLVTLEVRNQAGNKSSDYVLVNRAKDAIIPEIDSLDGLGSRDLPFDSTTAWVKWKVSDNHKIARVTINDSEISAGENMIFGLLLSLNISANVAKIVATDSSGNHSTKTVVIKRAADTLAPKIMRINGLTDKVVRWSDSSFVANWSVYEEGKALTVWIQNGVIAGNSGEYSKEIILALGINKLSIKAKDRAGNISTDTVIIKRSPPRAKSIASRGGRTIALLEDGTVRLWGDSYRASLDVPDSVKNNIGIGIGGTHYLAIRRDSSVVAWGSNSNGQCDVPSNAGKIIAVSGGGNHSLALRSNGTVIAWGSNLQGQTAVPTGLSNVVSIAAGLNFSAAVVNDGSVVVWGDPSDGVLTIPAITNAAQVTAGNTHVVVLTKDGNVVAWGANSDSQCSVPRNAKMVKRVITGAFHSIAILMDGSLVAWGRNNEKQLDIPQGSFEIMDISAGNFYSAAIRKDGSVIGWGANTAGQLNFPQELLVP
jgi:hypothetical protein